MDKQVKAVIFDMDGLLLDTEIIAYKIFNEILNQYGHKIDLDTYSNFVGLTKSNFVAAIQIQFSNLQNPQKIVDSLYLKMKEELSTSIPDIKQGALQSLKNLKEREIPLAVATSTYREQADQLLKKTGLWDFFDVVVTGDMVENSKPSPDIFLETMNRLSVNNTETLILEDSANGIRAVHAAGAQPILVPDMKMPSKQVQDMAIKIYSSLLDFSRDLENGKFKF